MEKLKIIVVDRDARSLASAQALLPGPNGHEVFMAQTFDEATDLFEEKSWRKVKPIKADVLLVNAEVPLQFHGSSGDKAGPIGPVLALRALATGIKRIGIARLANTQWDTLAQLCDQQEVIKIAETRVVISAICMTGFDQENDEIVHDAKTWWNNTEETEFWKRQSVGLTRAEVDWVKLLEEVLKE